MSTGIEWTDETWNPVRGCSIVSKGCTNCYAMKQAHRFAGAGKPYAGLTRLTKGGPVWTGEVRLVPELLELPLHWKRPRLIFVNSMSDLFHEDVPDEFIERVFAVMAEARHHTFQILTKRPARMRALLSSDTFEDYVTEIWRERDADRDTWSLMFPLPHVWLGVSVEDQATADERIPLLLQTPAAVRFVSYEPALGPVSFRWLAAWNGSALKPRGPTPAITNEYDGLRMLQWVIVGGESGPKARPFDLVWARSTVAQCKVAGVPVFVKQLGSAAWQGAFTDFGGSHRLSLMDRAGANPDEWPADLRVRQFPDPQ